MGSGGAKSQENGCALFKIKIKFSSLHKSFAFILCKPALCRLTNPIKSFLRLRSQIPFGTAKTGGWLFYTPLLFPVVCLLFAAVHLLAPAAILPIPRQNASAARGLLAAGVKLFSILILYAFGYPARASVFISSRKMTPGVPPNKLTSREKGLQLICTEKKEPIKLTAKNAQIPCAAVQRRPRPSRWLL